MFALILLFENRLEYFETVWLTSMIWKPTHNNNSKKPDMITILMTIIIATTTNVTAYWITVLIKLMMLIVCISNIGWHCFNVVNHTYDPPTNNRTKYEEWQVWFDYDKDDNTAKRVTPTAIQQQYWNIFLV